MPAEKNPYDILGVSVTATREEVKAAYRKLSKEYHPDKNKGNKEAEAMFKDIAWAYEILSDEKNRHRFDTTGFSAVIDIESEAITYVSRTFMSIVSQVWTHLESQPDLIDIAFKKVMNDRVKEKQDLSIARSQMYAFEQILEKLKTDREDDFLSALLKGELKKARLNEIICEDNLKVLDAAEEILHEYSCDFTVLRQYLSDTTAGWPAYGVGTVTTRT